MKRQDFEKMIELIQDVNSKKQFANTDEKKLDVIIEQNSIMIRQLVSILLENVKDWEIGPYIFSRRM